MWEQPVPESGPTSGGCRGHETTSDPSPVLGSVWCPVSVYTLPGLWCWTFQWVFFLQKGVRALAGTSLSGEGWSPLPAPGCCCLLSAKPVPQLGCLPQSDVGAQRAWPGPCLVVSAP